MIGVRADRRELFPEKDVDEFFAIDGETVKHVVESRRIFRFERGGRYFYMKVHYGVGWGEIFKNLLQLKMPIIGAEHEWRAIRAFNQPNVDIATTPLVAWGKQGWNPATQRSFIITDALDDTVDLEHWLPELEKWPKQAERLRLKRAIIQRLGDIAKRLHSNGMNHRDFYLCHFRLDISKAEGLPSTENLQLYLMDLHRVEQRDDLPERWAVKDIAGLLFSALFDSKGIVLNRSDIIRFIDAYTENGWRHALVKNKQFYRKVLQRIMRTYKKDKGKVAPLPAFLKQWYDQDSKSERS